MTGTHILTKNTKKQQKNLSKLEQINKQIKKNEEKQVKLKTNK